MSDFNEAIPIVLKHEGGFVNDSHDMGGATNFGISLKFLKSMKDTDKNGYLPGDLDKDGDVDSNDIRNMSVDDAINIYKSQWWDRYQYGLIADQDTATKVFDLAVNMGAGQAHKLLQRAINCLGNNLKEDGILGSRTMLMINYVPELWLMDKLKIEAAKFYLSLCDTDRERLRYLSGWLKRALA
jgi:lysozyme family protein